ncbi:M28 family metallopeptidase [Sphingomonas sp.]|jgi:hypothetical protein|uniref:M28 family metallopeptidase n=1 Tax=Sphingomonas sp. TaxID=28214 RepID=UPI002D7EF7E4|nr:M28 family metallopeptidase [Sphingomonas sp.]HEU0044860.1 M28 family metallopeptidase [Sphingomonas sp.]
MRSLPLILALMLGGTALAQSAVPERVDRWWQDVTMLSGDEMDGRAAGTAGHERAVVYVEGRLRALGLTPAGDKGSFRQEVAIEEQRIDAAMSSASLEAGGRTTALAIGSDLLLVAGGAPRAGRTAAPLVFAGYGLHLPRLGHDDFAGLDLKGKIVVTIAGGPATLPGAAKAANRLERVRLLGERGALGLITLTPPKQVEIPWARQKLGTGSPGRYLADKRLRTMPDNFFGASFDPSRSELLFEGSGYSFAELAALSDASRPIPRFALSARLSATLATSRRRITSPNVIGRIDGSDARRKAEHVVLTAHLDHLGMGAPINGDRIYNGTLDNAAGVATLLDVAARLKAGVAPRRSVLIVLVTGEEGGLLGSGAFASAPTVAKRSVVANLNFDMALPLFPLRSIIALGAEESSLGTVARQVGERMGLPLVPDPFPDRNSFIRSDQYSFVRNGVPALAFKFGFAKDTLEAKIETGWRATRYHAPSDDLDQPGIQKEDAIRLDDYVTALTREIANAHDRPRWLPGSVFGR